METKVNQSILYIIADPNGAGKTTASMNILPSLLDCNEFVNADEIAKGLSPFKPEDVAADWDGIYEVSPNSSAYSTMVIDKDNDIAFFYEENRYNGGFDMMYKN